MKLHTIAPAVGSTAPAKRVGRGIGSGRGKTAGRGSKGQKSRSGGGVRPGFEGGTMPLVRRVPKRGFNNARFAKAYSVVNVKTLERIFENGDVVDAKKLFEKGALSEIEEYGLKILGDGELTKNLTVRAEKFTETARKKIEAAGGKAEVL